MASLRNKKKDVKPKTCVINGVEFHHGEMVAVRYMTSPWSQAQLEYHYISRVAGHGRGWFIVDVKGNCWPARLMNGIRKLSQ